MNRTAREALGIVSHQAMVRYFDGKSPILTEDDWEWEKLDEETKELYRCEAEAVVKKLAEFCIIPVLNILLTENDIKSLLTPVEKEETHE